jgi:hypothetical protein
LLADSAQALGVKWGIPPVAGGWTDDGAVVRLTTAADQVSIGKDTMVNAASKSQVVGPDAASCTADFFSHSDTNSHAVEINGHVSRGSAASPTNVQTGKVVGRYRFFAYSNGAYRAASLIACDVENYVGNDDFSTLLEYYTRPTGAGAALVRRIRILGDGNVIIGSGGAPHTKLHVEGPIALAYTSTSADLTLDNTHSTVAVDTSGGNRIITLPTAVGIAGRVYTIKRITAGANTLTVDANGTETIDGALTVLLPNQWDVVRVQSDGANWLII